MDYQNTMLEVLGIENVELTKDKVVMTMPVGPKTHQPLGLLHGGASVALAESAASIGTYLNIDPDTQAAVGIEINANHIRSKKSGIVTAIAVPLHRGRRTMVWDIKITDEEGNLISVSRCTTAIVG
ncbi:hotdog fold thioesterase [Bacillus marinisedimentorum]|uniref:hotdog fold thioesterase n=1 Tax=Bacillus marinisedimentorum TaxID=1821260 RepID=UPI000871FFD4|nr:hotdog fold thioesterase [Bacillus marinisedimentorum]